jgi:hypothetical protein
MGDERSDALDGKPFVRSDFQCGGLVDCQESEEPSPRLQTAILRGFGQAGTGRLGEGVVVVKGPLPEQPVGWRPLTVD